MKQSAVQQENTNTNTTMSKRQPQPPPPPPQAPSQGHVTKPDFRQPQYPPPGTYDPQGPPPLRPCYFPPGQHAPANHFHLASSSSDSSPYGPRRGPMPPPPPPNHHQQQQYKKHGHPSYYAGPNHSETHPSSSFESHGSSHASGGVPPYIGTGTGGGTYVPYPVDPNFPPPPLPPSMPHHHRYPMHHQPFPVPPPPHSMMMGAPPGYPMHYYAWSSPIEYVTDVKPTDVLAGRGGATNAHSGNRAFRKLVKEHQDEYFRAKKKDKPSIAAAVVRIIREKGGRFLRRCDGVQGEALYYDIGDSRANEKACQALREGAPNLREKRRKGSTTSDEDDKYTSSEASIKACKTETVSSPSSTFDRLSSTRGGRQGTDIKERAQRDDLSERGSNDASGKREENIIIRPSAALLRRSRVDPFSVDTLSAQDREYYLHDFFPPDPVFYQCESKQQTAICPQPYRQPDDSAEGDSSGPWAQIAKV